jgi:DNA damage-binding protein 1
MKSMNLLVYKAEEGVLEERAMDYGSAWMTAVEILDDDTFLGAENSFNLFTMRKNSEAASDDDRGKLQVVFETIQDGSLVMQNVDP